MALNTQAAKEKMDKATMIKWAITFLTPIMLAFIPASGIYTGQVKLFCIVTLFGILIIAFELVDSLIPSLILPLGYLLLGVAPKEVVFEPWSGPMPWMFLGMFLFANTLERIGLIKRVAYWCIVKFGKNFTGLAMAVLVAGTILSLVLPGGNAHVPLMFLVYGICKSVGWNNTKESALLMMFATLGTYGVAKFIMNPYVLMMLDMAKYEGSIDFFRFFIGNAIFVPWILLVAFMMFKVLKPKNEMPPKTFFLEKYQGLGKLSFDEKKGIIVSIVMIGMILTLNVHKIAMGWCFVIVACLLFLPGINIGTKEDIKSINFSMPFFVGACMTIGSVASGLGLGKVIADMALPYMANMGTTGYFLVVMVICVLGNFVMSPLGIMATFTVPLVNIATALNIGTLPAVYSIYFSMQQIIFPYEFIAYLVMFSFGMMTMKDFMKVYGIKMVMSFVFMVVAVIPYWYLIGLL